MRDPWRIRDRIDDSIFVEVCERAKSMSQAAAELGLHFNSFKKRALELGCYKPNQAGIGVRKHKPRIPIEDIIVRGLHPQYQSYKLKQRLIDEGIKKPFCENCFLEDWMGMPLSFELHHVDGDRTNHAESNLVLLCPNCHSQTETFRSKNRKS